MYFLSFLRDHIVYNARRKFIWTLLAIFPTTRPHPQSFCWFILHLYTCGWRWLQCVGTNPCRFSVVEPLHRKLLLDIYWMTAMVLFIIGILWRYHISVPKERKRRYSPVESNDLPDVRSRHIQSYRKTISYTWYRLRSLGAFNHLGGQTYMIII